MVAYRAEVGVVEQVITGVSKILKVVHSSGGLGLLEGAIGGPNVEALLAAELDHALLLFVVDEADNSLVAEVAELYELLEGPLLPLAEGYLGFLGVFDLYAGLNSSFDRFAV